MTAVLALRPQEAMGQDPAAKVRLELVVNEGWELTAFGFDRGTESEPKRLQCLVQQRRF